MNCSFRTIGFFLFFISAVTTTVSGQNDIDILFERIDPKDCGIHFSNDIVENLSTKENLFDFDYFYNGAGVGIGDFNNDGLQDIVFCANQKENEIYINKGDFKLELVSGALNSPGKKYWSNGVTIVDINNDGHQDIYVSQGGPHQADQRANLLYINNGNLTFTESAEKYGLADSGISTQSAFFDYDKDGDLDCVVMNETSFYGLDPIGFYQAVGEDEQVFWENCSHFYINENGTYEDATEKVGLLKPSFGLGLSVSDLNADGWQDIYIANDYYVPDAMYINQGDGTFKDQVKEMTSQLSFYGMGVDVADINNDGHQDIFVLDMASSDHYRSKTLMKSMNVDNFSLLVNTLRFPHQYMFNSLQINDGNHHYSNVSQLTGVAKTDWSWSVLMNDYDLDGHKDIFITNGYRRYALDNDFQNEVSEAKTKYDGDVPLSVKQELYQKMPSEPLSNIMYQNIGDLEFKESTKEWGLYDPSFSSGAAIADFDKDGDLDLVVSNIDAKAYLLRNLSSENDKGNYLIVRAKKGEEISKISMRYGNSVQEVDGKRVRGYMSSSEPVFHFGLGSVKKVEKVEILWADGTTTELNNVKTNRTINASKKSKTKEPNEVVEKLLYSNIMPKDIGISFVHNENKYDDFAKEILLPYKQSTLGPNVKVEDVNNDNLDDLLFLGAAKQTNQLYLQTEEGFELMKVDAFSLDKNYEDLDAVFFDLNGDGWKDIYFVTGGNSYLKEDSYYKDRVYINAEGKGFEPINQSNLEFLRYSGKIGKAWDFDLDGDEDLIIGNRMIPQMYPYHAPSLILENNNGILEDVTDAVAPSLRDFGIINDIEITDFDFDGDLDFIAVGEWSHIGVFLNNNKKFEESSQSYGFDKYKGWWYSIATTDANDDGKKDFIIGNMGLNSKYTSSQDKPLRVYAGDMDDNGTWDLVLSKKYKENYVPFRGRECSSQQMPFIQEKFPTYDLFASASIEEVYGEQLKDSYEAYATEFASIALISSGNTYKISKLPNTAQLSPILDGIELDEGAILVGNIYNTEVETPRLDMGNGISIDYSQGEIISNKSSELGLNLGGNVKSISQVNHKGLNKIFIIAGVNDGPLKIYEKSKSE